MASVEEIRALPDPVERAAQAVAYIRRGTAALSEARRIRDSALHETQGLTAVQLAEATGITPGYIRLLRWKTRHQTEDTD